MEKKTWLEKISYAANITKMADANLTMEFESTVVPELCDELENAIKAIARVAQLKEFINKLIEVGNEMVHEDCLFGGLSETSIDKYDELVKDWGEK